MNYKFYVKKLTSNELGYRKGKLSTGQMFYISKQAIEFFPTLSKTLNNATVTLEFEVEYRKDPIFINLVYHNDKYNRDKGTRDEFRIYLNREIAPDDFFFRPDDIIIFERISETRYRLNKFREGNDEYSRFNKMIENTNFKGKHLLSSCL